MSLHVLSVRYQYFHMGCLVRVVGTQKRGLGLCYRFKNHWRRGYGLREEKFCILLFC
jgi:hypothetical protein